NPITRKMIRFTLESAGHEVVEAEDGTSALRLLEERRPGLVVQDLALPDMDGVDLLVEIRRRTERAGIPVRVLTGRTGELDEPRVRGGTFDDFLTKPAEPSRLVAAIERHLERPPVPRAIA